MTRIELAKEIDNDLERFLRHLTEHGATDAPERIGQLLQALALLKHSPLIGRPVAGDKRELVIGQGARGYLALYRFYPLQDLVIVLAVRAQRERGYARPT